ncbi:MAG: hypothetical protein JXA64_07630 [Candidatus Fermentibacteraceae bacterium]|nr:hypothetical protein [Candidatus Fermentibacteraceae bacterium]MBN2608969.1 hypothetical protein [Candidatus Fermentibacteraceae bacterium]
MIFRSMVVLVLIGLLWVLGVVDLQGLPWHAPDFQVSGATVLVYLLWSAWESRHRSGSAGLPYMLFYAVLLISAVDGFLLEITKWGPPWILRWTGLSLFTAGCCLRAAAYRRSSSRLLRLGRYLQLAGLPVALGSIAGTAVALAAGIPGSIHEELELPSEADTV